MRVRMTVLALESLDKHIPANQMGCTDFCFFPPPEFSQLSCHLQLEQLGNGFFGHISSVEADSCPHSQPCVCAHFP